MKSHDAFLDWINTEFGMRMYTIILTLTCLTGFWMVIQLQNNGTDFTN